ncbi:MAG: TIGR00300 family protein, partial [Armatimonadota bacterium]
MVTEKITLQGDLLEARTLSRVLDLLNERGITFRLRTFRVGEFADVASLAELELTAPDYDTLRAAVTAAQALGATNDATEARIAIAEQDGVLPEDFYSTTNFPTYVLTEGRAIPVENLEMDCGIRLLGSGDDLRAETCAMHRVRRGDRLVVGYEGIRVTIAAPSEAGPEFRFMANDVSSERPKARMIAEAAEAMRVARDRGERVLLVGGPAIVHSGSAPRLAAL